MTPQNKINITSINESNYNINSMKENKSTRTNKDNTIKESKDNIFNDYE